MKKYVENKIDMSLSELKDLEQNYIRVISYEFGSEVFTVAKSTKGEWRMIMGDDYSRILEMFDSEIVSLEKVIKAIEKFRATLGDAKEFTFKKRKLGHMTENAHKILSDAYSEDSLEDSLVAVYFNGIKVICTDEERVVFNLKQTKESLRMQESYGRLGVFF